VGQARYSSHARAFEFVAMHHNSHRCCDVVHSEVEDALHIRAFCPAHMGVQEYACTNTTHRTADFSKGFATGPAFVNNSNVGAEFNAAGHAETREDAKELTNLMIRNIPSRVRKAELLAVIRQIGFDDMFSFLYLPMKPRHADDFTNRGYAFVGFEDAGQAADFSVAITGYTFPRRSSKAIYVEPARLQDSEEIRPHLSKDKVPRKWRPILKPPAAD